MPNRRQITVQRVLDWAQVLRNGKIVIVITAFLYSSNFLGKETAKEPFNL